jgi:uncharacterized membrane protein
MKPIPFLFKIQWLSPGRLFLILGALVGLLYCVFIPYGAGFDEEQHVVRIFDIAAFNLLPNHSDPDGTPAYGDFLLQSYQRRYFQTPADDMLTRERFWKPIDTSITVAFPTRSIYPPIDFAPQALIARLFWRKYAAPVIPVAILSRIAGLLLYLAGSYLAIRWLPVGKWVMMILALAPMALFQAATLNADGFTNAASFLFIAMMFNIQADPAERIRPWKLWTLVGLIILLGLTKTGTILILPLLLVLPFRKINSKKWVGVLAVAAILSAVVMLGWNLLSIPGSHFSDTGGQSLSQQMHVIAANPLDFVKTFFIGNILAIVRYYRDWVGVYGYWIGTVPELIYWLFPLVLLAGLLAEPRFELFSRKTRLVTLGVFAVASAGIAFMYSYLHYNPGDFSSFGRQGRYFIFTAPLFFLGLAGLSNLNETQRRLSKVIALDLLLVVIGLYSFGIYTTYYTYCGSSLYTFQGCIQPVYKNLDVSPTAPQAILSQTTPLTQSFTSVCGRVSSVDVDVKKLAGQTEGVLRLSLLTSNNQVVSSRDFPLSSLNPNMLVMLPVSAADWPETPKSSLLTIRLETPGLAATDGVGLAISVPKQYRDGSFTAGGVKQDADLVFHYTCANPWTGN